MPRWIATRRTAEDTIVHLWPDGSITWALGRYIQNAPPRPPRKDDGA